MELEDSQFEDSLELIAKFEDKCLKPLRTAKCKDLDMKKMVEIVEWAKLIDKLSSRMDPSFMKQTDRLFLALIDNPRLPNETLLKYVSLLYETDKLLSKAKLCIEQRNQIRKTLLLDFSVSKNNHPLREFLRSDRGEHNEVLDKSDIQILLLKESLKLQRSETEKVNTVIEFMKSDHFKSKEELSNLLQAVKEEDDKLVVKIYETISQ